MKLRFRYMTLGEVQPHVFTLLAETGDYKAYEECQHLKIEQGRQIYSFDRQPAVRDR